MFVTPEEAREMDCPVKPEELSCSANDCMAWRWKTAMPGSGEGDMYVMMNSQTGVQNPMKIPTHGYCGLAGKPEVA